MKWVTLFGLAFGLLLVTSCASMSGSGGNCRLIAQTFYESGKKEVDVSTEAAGTYDECRFLAQQRELDSEFNEQQSKGQTKTRILISLSLNLMRKEAKLFRPELFDESVRMIAKYALGPPLVSTGQPVSKP